MRWWRFIWVFILALLPASLAAEELDMDEYLYGHVLDSYEWHITTVNGKPVSIPLPVIVYSRTTGWHVFSSHHLEEGEYEGFFLVHDPESHKWAVCCHGYNSGPASVGVKHQNRIISNAHTPM